MITKVLTLVPLLETAVVLSLLHISCFVFLSPYLSLFPSLFLWLYLCFFPVHVMVPGKLVVNPSLLLTHYKKSSIYLRTYCSCTFNSIAFTP